MFCIKCGTKLPDDALFCMQCGASLKSNTDTPEEAQGKSVASTKLQKAQCTNCNAPLEVDPSQSAAICPFCNTAYIVDQAIQNYNFAVSSGNMSIANAVINVANNSNLENLLLRARSFEDDGDYNSAIEYFNRILDEDINHREAKEGLARVKQKAEDYVYHQTSGNTIFSFGNLQLKKGRFIFVTKNGKETVYYLDRMSKVRTTMGLIGFVYDNKGNEITYGCQNAKQWLDIILNAKNNFYPPIEPKFTSLSDEIRAKFTPATRIKAVKYCREKTGMSLPEAMNFVDRIL